MNGHPHEFHQVITQPRKVTNCVHHATVNKNDQYIYNNAQLIHA